MANREQSGTNLDPGLIQRVAQGIRYVVRGVTPDSWFGPSQPLAPLAQDKTEGRQFDYPVGFNLRITPRQEEAISFSQLRALADNYDLMRLIIEKRKDQIEAFDWEIVPANEKDSAEQYAGAIDDVTAFFQKPDKQNNWQQWLRQIVEEMLVIDAVCVYPRANRGGGLYGFELVDGATIKRVLDVNGRTPLPPDPAYQQILKGIPAADYSADDLVYAVRNPRVWKIYGFSVVEQVITTVNIALRRQTSQLAFYTAGNIPEALVQVAAEWTPKQIVDFQQNWDALMEGNLSERRKMKFLPPAKQIDFPKANLIKDEFDEWLARIVCFAFSVSPSALIKQVNRASGEQMADTAKEEGLMPLLRFLELFFTGLLQTNLKQPKLKFKWKIVNRVNPLEQAQVDKIYADLEAITPDEIRVDRLGKDEMTPEERQQAFPTPIPAGFNADGTPILPKGAPNAGVGDGGGGDAGAPAQGGKPTPAAPTAAEKMLAQMIDQWGPEQLAKVLADVARAQPPAVVELKPEVNVSVGDTNVHVPMNKALAKNDAAPIEIHNHVQAANAPQVHVAGPQVTVNTPPQSINVTTPDVKATINVEAPEINVDAPVTVENNVPTPDVQVNIEGPGATEETLERDSGGNITRVVKRPLK